MIELNHTIVPALDKQASAEFYINILGLELKGKLGPFVEVRVNTSLTLDFKTVKNFDSHHYAFKVSDDTFDEIVDRIKQAGIDYGSEPKRLDDMQFNERFGGRGVYFLDPNGHVLELLTVG